MIREKPSVSLCHPAMIIESHQQKPASRLSPDQRFGVDRELLSRRGLPPFLPIALSCSLVSFLARALPPMRANSVTVRAFFTSPLYHVGNLQARLSTNAASPLSFQVDLAFAKAKIRYGLQPSAVQHSACFG